MLCINKTINYVSKIPTRKKSALPSFTGINSFDELQTDTTEFASRKNPEPMRSKFTICECYVKSGGYLKTPELYPKDYITKNSYGYGLNPTYHIDKLWSSAKGEGKTAVQSIVWKSLASSKTEGRVTLDACCLDGITASGGFYYKLGFRFLNPNNNKICEQWIKSGGKYGNAPFAIGRMYLPKENIEHCLKYGLNDEELSCVQKKLNKFKICGFL